MQVALIDTGHANLRSVARALERAGEQRALTVLTTHDPEVIARSDQVVVPGQGGFGDCLRALRAAGADQAVLEHIASGKPYLGICLGLQALFEGSEESPDTPGLGVFRGHCQRLGPAPGIKIPHMGWNELALPDDADSGKADSDHAPSGNAHPVLQQAGGAGSWFYFVHSYHALPRDPDVLKASVTHGPHRVTAAIGRDNVLATQFHPEKSQEAGLRLLRAFLAWRV